jgi:hypothetical protein
VDEVMAQDWLRAILKVRKEVPGEKLEQYDAVTADYVDSLHRQGIRTEKLDLDV